MAVVGTVVKSLSGKDRGLDGVDNITGATFSSNYFRAAIADAFTAFELVKG